MTAQQYSNMISDVFGSDIQIGTPIPPLMRAPDGSAVHHRRLGGYPRRPVDAVTAHAPTSIATQVVDKGDIGKELPAHRSYLVPRKPKADNAPDDACAAKFIRSTGRLLFRRSLDEAQVTEWVGKAHEGTEHLKDFYAGLGERARGHADRSDGADDCRHHRAGSGASRTAPSRCVFDGLAPVVLLVGLRAERCGVEGCRKR